jgi:hypothetical protein
MDALLQIIQQTRAFIYFFLHAYHILTHIIFSGVTILLIFDEGHKWKPPH